MLISSIIKKYILKQGGIIPIPIKLAETKFVIPKTQKGKAPPPLSCTAGKG